MAEINNKIILKAKEKYGNKYNNFQIIQDPVEIKELHLKTIHGKDIDKKILDKMDTFQSRTWVVLLNNNENIPLCISDNPVSFGNSSGRTEVAYLNPGAIIYFPL